LNLWSSFRDAPPQRSARLYRALVNRGLASAVSGALLPTEQPFLYYLSATATAGVSLDTIEAALEDEIAQVRQSGISDTELDRAKAQLKARFVFDNDSITSIAHQLGYFETIADAGLFFDLAARVDAVTIDEVANAARLLTVSNRTVGWFEPVA
jgi:zinc protease